MTLNVSFPSLCSQISWQNSYRILELLANGPTEPGAYYSFHVSESLIFFFPNYGLGKSTVSFSLLLTKGYLFGGKLQIASHPNILSPKICSKLCTCHKFWDF